jgi:hypothetical protein
MVRLLERAGLPEQLGEKPASRCIPVLADTRADERVATVGINRSRGRRVTPLVTNALGLADVVRGDPFRVNPGIARAAQTGSGRAGCARAAGRARATPRSGLSDSDGQGDDVGQFGSVHSRWEGTETVYWVGGVSSRTP